MLIDKEALMESIGITEECKDCKKKGTFGCNESSAFAYACEQITYAPGIDLVKCKECKYYDPNSRDFSCEQFSDLGSANSDDDYCAWGERK